jgi:hypothetical protein
MALLPDAYNTAQYAAEARDGEQGARFQPAGLAAAVPDTCCTCRAFRLQCFLQSALPAPVRDAPTSRLEAVKAALASVPAGRDAGRSSRAARRDSLLAELPSLSRRAGIAAGQVAERAGPGVRVAGSGSDRATPKRASEAFRAAVSAWCRSGPVRGGCERGTIAAHLSCCSSHGFEHVAPSDYPPLQEYHDPDTTSWPTATWRASRRCSTCGSASRRARGTWPWSRPAAQPCRSCH